uniref:Putative ovule protein n=1 Tax=Solanum chacoense TaxID=4108 RepID=A0A0V0H2V7_SOLCH
MYHKKSYAYCPNSSRSKFQEVHNSGDIISKLTDGQQRTKILLRTELHLIKKLDWTDFKNSIYLKICFPVFIKASQSLPVSVPFSLILFEEL